MMREEKLQEVELEQVEKELDLEIVELEEKTIPRNWHVYALVYSM